MAVIDSKFMWGQKMNMQMVQSLYQVSQNLIVLIGLIHENLLRKTETLSRAISPGLEYEYLHLVVTLLFLSSSCCRLFQGLLLSMATLCNYTLCHLLSFNHITDRLVVLKSFDVSTSVQPAWTLPDQNSNFDLSMAGFDVCLVELIVLD